MTEPVTRADIDAALARQREEFAAACDRAATDKDGAYRCLHKLAAELRRPKCICTVTRMYGGVGIDSVNPDCQVHRPKKKEP